MSAKRAKTGRPVKVPGEKSTKERIFDSAVDLFAEKGYDGISIRDIARSAGITEGAVYRHYEGKEAILDAIFAYVENYIYPEAPEYEADAIASAMTLEAFLQGMPQAMAASPIMTKITRIMVIEMYHNGKMRDYVRRELFERPIGETGAIFRKFMEKGKIRACDTDAMATMFISYLVYWYYETFIFGFGEAQNLDGSLRKAQANIESFARLLAPETNRT